jgi:hypothetical protein
MRPRRLMTLLLLLVPPYALLPGCASKMPPPSPIDFAVSRTRAPDETLVLGRFCLIENHRESPFLPWKRELHDWGEPKARSIGLRPLASFADADVFVLYVDGGAFPEPVYYIPRGDGTFVWKLKPGAYRITEGYYQKDEKAWALEFREGGPAFQVSGEEPLIYIGTLTMLLCDGKNLGNLKAVESCLGRDFIDNDVDAATDAMRRLVPGIEGRPAVKLMTGYPRASVDSLLTAGEEDP